MGSVIPVIIPHENVNDESVKILQWFVSDGDTVSIDQRLVEVETSKSTFEIQSPATGVVQRIAGEKIEIPVGNVLCYVGDSLAAIGAFRSGQNAAPSPNSQLEHQTSIGSKREPEPCDINASIIVDRTPCNGSRFSRAALELIRTNGLSEETFSDRGLVRERDILAHLGKPVAVAAMERQANSPVPHAAAGVPVRSEPMPRTKRFETRLLSWSRNHAIRSSVTVCVPTRGLAALKRRDPVTAEFFAAAVIFEAARLLRKYPHLNAYADDENAYFYDKINIGYALDAGCGLRVPVLRDADIKSLPDIVAERRQILTDYLGDAIRPEAMAGSTFTVTDLSGDDVFAFDPLLVEAQSAILGIGAEYELPGAVASVYNLILAFDHRLVEGRMAARFLGELKSRLQAHEEAMADRVAASPDSEPCCSRCLVSLSEIQRMQGYLLQAAGRKSHETKFVCSICLAGF